MTSKLKASLEGVIERWLNRIANDIDRPDSFIAENLHVRMAEAAAAVFDASHEAQVFAKQQE